MKFKNTLDQIKSSNIVGSIQFFPEIVSLKSKINSKYIGVGNEESCLLADKDTVSPTEKFEFIQKTNMALS